MKYVLLGSAGNVTRPLAETLIQAGHDVTVVGRNAANIQAISGAKAAIGAVEDVDFLRSTFKGADAVYLMIPPKFDTTAWKKYIGSVGAGFAQALRESGVKYAAFLSSLGADLPEGCGPITGLYAAEQALNQAEGLNIVHLRAGYFYDNFLANVSLVNKAGIIGSNFQIEGDKFLLADPKDIAAAAADLLLHLDFKGIVVRNVVSDKVSTNQVATTIGKAIDKPALPWIRFSDEDTLNAMKGAGLPEENAVNYVEMGQALDQGLLLRDYEKNNTDPLGAVKLAEFAKRFATVYAQS